jgi:hypothetical protein
VKQQQTKLAWVAVNDGPERPVLLVAGYGGFLFEILYFWDSDIPFVLYITANGEDCFYNSFNDPWGAMNHGNEFMELRGWEGDPSA